MTFFNLLVVLKISYASKCLQYLFHTVLVLRYCTNNCAAFGLNNKDRTIITPHIYSIVRITHTVSLTVRYTTR